MDITYCKATGCPLAANCLRSTAPTQSIYSMFVEPPFKEGACEMQIKVDEVKKVRKPFGIIGNNKKFLQGRRKVR